MEEVEKLLHWLSNVLDNRVFVALTRGLWDLTSKDVLDYTEDLREGGGGGGGGAGAGAQRVRVTLRGGVVVPGVQRGGPGGFPERRGSFDTESLWICWPGRLRVPLLSLSLALAASQQDAWRGRQSAATTLAHMDSFFKTVLTSSMGNDLQVGGIGEGRGQEAVLVGG